MSCGKRFEEKIKGGIASGICGGVALNEKTWEFDVPVRCPECAVLTGGKDGIKK